MTDNKPAIPAKPDTVVMEDLHQFVTHLTRWHTAKVKMVKHMQKIPEGTEVTVDDGLPQELSGDMLKGFRIGLTLALVELGELPFSAEFVNADKTATKH
jgi:hypothetical protein